MGTDDCVLTYDEAEDRYEDHMAKALEDCRARDACRIRALLAEELAAVVAYESTGDRRREWREREERASELKRNLRASDV